MCDISSFCEIQDVRYKIWCAQKRVDVTENIITDEKGVGFPWKLQTKVREEIDVKIISVLHL